MARTTRRKRRPAGRNLPYRVVAFRKGIVLLAIATVVFVALGIGTPDPEARLTFVSAVPICFGAAGGLLRALFGRAAFAIPFSLAVIGVVQLRRLHINRRWRLSLASAATTVLLAIVLGATGSPFGATHSWGGIVGGFSLAFFERALGAVFGPAAAASSALVSLCLLWDFRPWESRAVRQATIRLWQRIQRACAGGLRLVGSPLTPATRRIANSVTPSPDRAWTPPTFGLTPPTRSDPFTPGLGSGRWGGVDGATSDESDEASFCSLPDPEQSVPMAIDVLPDNPTVNPEREAIASDLMRLQQRIVDVLDRTTGLKVRSSASDPLLGLSSILFEFEKEPFQKGSVRSLERAVKDIGVETGRSPVRVSIQDKIRVELPLLDPERAFAPILPLLQETQGDHGRVTFLLGRHQDGSPFQLDVRDARHMLVAGGTGGGKTVLLHSLIFGLIFRYSPQQVRLALADMKVFEFSRYRGLPHLWQEVATTREGLQQMVSNLSAELKRRKAERAKNESTQFPVIVTIIDEFSDFSSDKLVRLIAEARAVDMYFVLATQHPTADVISSSIKANLLTGVAFNTQNTTASRLIVGASDAVSLRPNGDCLVRWAGGFERIQAGWVTTPRDCADSDLAALMEVIKNES